MDHVEIEGELPGRPMPPPLPRTVRRTLKRARTRQERRARPEVISTRRREEAIEAAILFSAPYARTAPSLMPILFWDRVVGHTLGDGRGNGWFRRVDAKSGPLLECVNTGFNAILAAKQAGQFARLDWNKSMTSSGVANNWYDLYRVAGGNDAGSLAGAAYTAVRYDDTMAGAIPHGGNVSPSVKNLNRFLAYTTAANQGMLLLVDRVLGYESCSFNAAANKTLTNTLTALRYAGNTDPGLSITIVVHTTTGATVATLTQLRYTDNAGNTLQSVPVTGPSTFIASVTQGSATLGDRHLFPTGTAGTVPSEWRVSLATGDTGVQLVNDFTTSAANTGTFVIVLQYQLAWIPIVDQGKPTPANFVLAAGETLPAVKDGAFLNLLANIDSGAAFNVSGSGEAIWG